MRRRIALFALVFLLAGSFALVAATLSDAPSATATTASASLDAGLSSDSFSSFSRCSLLECQKCSSLGLICVSTSTGCVCETPPEPEP